VRQLIDAIEKRIGELGLRADPARESEHLTEITVYAAALATTQMKGKVVQP
jgi:hypothetical protein